MKRQSLIQQSGISTVTLAMLVMFIMTMITLISSHTALVQQRISGNDSRAKMTFDAADGGVDQALAHLIANKNTIVVDANNDGVMDDYTNSNITAATMANGSTFTATYSNPTNNNFNLLKISSRATSDDETATNTTQQMVALEPFLSAVPTASLIVKNDVNLTGNAVISNTSTNLNIWAGGTVSLGGSVQTASSHSGSDHSSTGNDIVQNDSNLSSITADDFFKLFFGRSKTDAQRMADIKLQGAGNYSNSLADQTGKFVWVDTEGGDATLNSNTTLGSADHPVIVVVDGNLRLNSNSSIYGMVYTTGEFTATGNADVHGAVVSETNLEGAGTPNITYDSSVLNNLQSTVGNYTKVAGSWRDF